MFNEYSEKESFQDRRPGALTTRDEKKLLILLTKFFDVENAW